MNEIYKLLQNVQEIARANNLFLQMLEQRIASMEAAVKIDISEPNATGTEVDTQIGGEN